MKIRFQSKHFLLLNIIIFSRIRLEWIDNLSWNINWSDFSRDNIGVNLIQIKEKAKYLIIYCDNTLQSFELKNHSKDWTLRHEIEECMCSEVEYQK